MLVLASFRIQVARVRVLVVPPITAWPTLDTAAIVLLERIIGLVSWFLCCYNWGTHAYIFWITESRNSLLNWYNPFCLEWNYFIMMIFYNFSPQLMGQWLGKQGLHADTERSQDVWCGKLRHPCICSVMEGIGVYSKCITMNQYNTRWQIKSCNNTKH